MKLEEASQHLARMVRRWRSCRANGTPESTNLLRFDALEVISAHIEATCWRKLREEKPLEPGDYEVGCWRNRNWKTCQQSWPPTIYSNGFPSWTEASHWRPIVGPEEEP